MKMITLAVLFSTSFAPFSFALEKQAFCARSPESILERAALEENRLAFQNDGGLFNGGVCWWHSRFERSANYLAVFRPELPMPSDREAKKIIHQLMLRRKVVEIPGFKSLREFSSAYENLIQKQLNRWQIRDGFGNQVWILSLSGKSELPVVKLKASMDKIYAQFEKYDSMLSLMLQFKGVVSHMWNLLSIEKTDVGYTLIATDSNYVDGNSSVKSPLMVATYRYGDTSLSSSNIEIINDNSTSSYDSFTPYPILNRLDLHRINKAINHYCSAK